MRVLSAAAIKAKVKRGHQMPLQEAPGEGTRIRELYDLLKASPGKPVDLKLRKKTGNRTAPGGRALIDLQDYYGLDIRLVQNGWKDRPSLHVLAGEWFGRVYVDYIAEQLEKGGKDGTKA